MPRAEGLKKEDLLKKLAVRISIPHPSKFHGVVPLPNIFDIIGAGNRGGPPGYLFEVDLRSAEPSEWMFGIHRLDEQVDRLHLPMFSGTTTSGGMLLVHMNYPMHDKVLLEREGFTVLDAVRYHNSKELEAALSTPMGELLQKAAKP
jgi:hypothetical protein